MGQHCDGVLVFDRDGGVIAFARLEDAARWMESIDVLDGEYERAYTADGHVVAITGVVDGPVSLVITQERDEPGLRDRLVRSREREGFLTDVDDPVAVVDEVMRPRRELPRRRRPTWLRRRRGAETRGQRTVGGHLAVNRRTYAVDKDITDRADAALACAAALAVLGPALRRAFVDVHTDHEDQMPQAVQHARAELAAIGRHRRWRWRDSLMAVVITKDDPAWGALETFAPWSIHVEVRGEGDVRLGTLHDCGYSIVLELTEDEAEAIRARLDGVAPVVPLADIHARRHAEKTERRTGS